MIDVAEPTMICNLLEQVLTASDQTFGSADQANHHEVTAAAQTILNVSVLLRMPEVSEEARCQLITFLLTTLLPNAVRSRKAALLKALAAQPAIGGGPSEFSKEVTCALQKADEVMVLFLQALGNMQLCANPEVLHVLFEELEADSVLSELLAVDMLINEVYQGKAPISCAINRSLIREVMFLDLAGS
jgi:hypothetical protein